MSNADEFYERIYDEDPLVVLEDYVTDFLCWNKTETFIVSFYNKFLDIFNEIRENKNNIANEIPDEKDREKVLIAINLMTVESDFRIELDELIWKLFNKIDSEVTKRFVTRYNEVYEAFFDDKVINTIYNEIDDMECRFTY